MERDRNRLFLAALAAAALAGGCASPTTGRVRDAHLLWASDPESRRIASYSQFGPFWERAETKQGAVRRSLRPFLWTCIEAAGASHDEILWPVWSRSRRGNELSWRFLFWFGLDKDVADEASRDRTWLFPLWFSGTAADGETYAALFPIYGTIREMYWDRVSFAGFPFWATWDRNGCHTWSVLWPFVQRQTGPGRDAWRVIPFWGRTTVEGEMESRFVMWPIWTEAEHFGRNPGSEWMLWPLVGRVDREDEDGWLVLPPLFNFSHGRGRFPEYRKINCPWPFVMINDDEDSHRRWFFPFYTRRWTDSGSIDDVRVLWPFWSESHVRLGKRRRDETSFFPVWHHCRIEADGGARLEEDYVRVWPLYSRRYDPENRLVRIPDLSFRKREGQLERNFFGMFTLYTRGETSGPRPRVDHEALWGILRRGYGEDYSAARVWPLWDSEEDGDAWHWNLLWGLIGRSGRGGESNWEFLWFFGDRLDEKEEGEGGPGPESAATPPPPEFDDDWSHPEFPEEDVP